MKALVLFKGTGSIDHSLEKYGFTVDSLDIDKKMQRHLDCGRSSVGSLERHSSRHLLVHLGSSPVPTVLKSSNNGQNPQKLDTGRQHRRANFGNHPIPGTKGLAHGKSTNGPSEDW